MINKVVWPRGVTKGYTLECYVSGERFWFGTSGAQGIVVIEGRIDEVEDALSGCKAFILGIEVGIDAANTKCSKHDRQQCREKGREGYLALYHQLNSGVEKNCEGTEDSELAESEYRSRNDALSDLVLCNRRKRCTVLIANLFG